MRRGNSGIVVTAWRGLVEVSNAPASLCSVLVAHRKVREQRGGRVVYTAEREQLYDLREDIPGTLTTHEGFLDRVTKHLDARGKSYRFVDRRKPPPKVDYSRLAGARLRDGQDKVLALITTSRAGGIVKCTGGYGKSHLIGFLAKLYEGRARLMVVSSALSVVRTLVDRMRGEIGRDKVCGVGGAYKGFCPSSDVAVVSRGSMHKVPDDWPDILVYDEVHGAGAGATAEAIMRFSKAVKWGFSATPQGRSDGTDAVVEALFGKIRFTYDYDKAEAGGIVVPITAHMLPVGGSVVYDNEMQKSLRGIVYNNLRNRAIAQAVAGIPRDVKTLVITATAEHAILLSRLLDGFALNFSNLSRSGHNRLRRKGVIDAAWRRPSNGDLLRRFRDGEVMRVVSTGSWSEGVDFPDLRCLVRADGSRGFIRGVQTGLRLSRTAEGKSDAVIIDFLDDFGEVFANRAADRVRHYESQGWTVVEGPPRWEQKE